MVKSNNSVANGITTMAFIVGILMVMFKITTMYASHS